MLDEPFDKTSVLEKCDRTKRLLLVTPIIPACLAFFTIRHGISANAPFLPWLVVLYLLSVFYAGMFTEFCCELRLGTPIRPDDARRFRAYFNPWVRAFLLPLLLPVAAFRLLDDFWEAMTGVVQWFGYRMNHPVEEGPGIQTTPLASYKPRTYLHYFFSLVPAIGSTVVVGPALGMFLPALLSFVPLLYAMLCYASYFDELSRMEEDREAHVVRKGSGVIWLGNNLFTGFAFIIADVLAAAHIFIKGVTGSGKTVAIASIISQLFANGRSVVVFDLKGRPDDNFFLGTIVRVCERLKLQPRIVCLQFAHGQPTLCFNPFAQPIYRKLPPATQAMTAAMMLALSYGLNIYGGAFFGSNNLIVLKRALKKLWGRYYTARTLADQLLVELRDKSLPHKEREAGTGAHAMMELLADIEALNPPEHAPGIMLEELFKEQTFLFVKIRHSEFGDLTGVIFRAFVRLLLLVAEESSGPSIVCACDEFARGAGSQLRDILEQAREKLWLVLSVQSLKGLDGRGFELADLAEQCSVQMAFSLSDQEAVALSDASGVETIYRPSYGRTFHAEISYPWWVNPGRGQPPYAPPDGYSKVYRVGDSVTMNPHDQPNISVDVAKAISAAPQTAFVKLVIDGADGRKLHGAQQAVVTPFLTSRAEYERRVAWPWPEQDGQIINGDESTGPPAPLLPPPPPPIIQHEVIERAVQRRRRRRKTREAPRVTPAPPTGS